MLLLLPVVLPHLPPCDVMLFGAGGWLSDNGATAFKVVPVLVFHVEAKEDYVTYDVWDPTLQLTTTTTFFWDMTPKKEKVSRLSLSLDHW